MSEEWAVPREPVEKVTLPRVRRPSWADAINRVRRTHPATYQVAVDYVHEHPAIFALAEPYGIQLFVAGACYALGQAAAQAGAPYDHAPADCADYRAGFEAGTDPTETESEGS